MFVKLKYSISTWKAGTRAGASVGAVVVGRGVGGLVGDGVGGLVGAVGDDEGDAVGLSVVGALVVGKGVG
jgi:hypothetical protein